MIHKIERLISIGKFRNYQATGDVAFKKLTALYGDNGCGKTTLTAILRSLTLNQPEIIRRRKSTNQATIPQAAQIITRDSAAVNTSHTFNHVNGWGAAFQDIEIFDIHFVNDNIYSGFEFNDEHRKHLHQFVIGAQGIAIQQSIEQNKANKTASRQAQAALEQEIAQRVGNDLSIGSISEFLAILPTESNSISNKIVMAEASLASANANATIQTLQPLTSLRPINPGIDFSAIRVDMQSTSETIQNESLKELFSQHCQDLSDNSIAWPEGWLHMGFGYIQRKQSTAQHEVTTCPLCKQGIDTTTEIMQAYAAKFDSTFNALVQRIHGHLATVNGFNLELKIQELNTTNQINLGHVVSWRPHLTPSTAAPNYDVIGDEAALRAELRLLVEQLQQKLQNPTVAVTSDAATTFQSTIQTINDKIDVYNHSIVLYNDSIIAFRRSIQTVSQAQNTLSALRRIESRFDPSVDALCTRLLAERQKLRALEAAYPELIQQQEAAAITFFGNYKTRINHYLGTIFKTLFRVDDVVNVPPQGMATQSKIGYKLTIDGEDISFDTTRNINAKDCLSEGDKSTIALAFFLSKLDIDPGIANKVVIFDDPLSSFDSNRRMYTVQLLKDLTARVKQLIVSSHSELFLHELFKLFAPNEKKALRISENFSAKASIIEPLDLDSLVENQYFKHIKELEHFLQRPDIFKKEIVLGWLRNVLEAHIRFKFYRQLSSIPPNGQTFGTLINHLATQGVVFRDNGNRSSIISKLNIINGISARPHHGEPLPDYTVLGINPNSMTVAELASFVTDTLDLVDNLI